MWDYLGGYIVLFFIVVCDLLDICVNFVFLPRLCNVGVVILLVQVNWLLGHCRPMGRPHLKKYLRKYLRRMDCKSRTPAMC